MSEIITNGNDASPSALVIYRPKPMQASLDEAIRIEGWLQVCEYEIVQQPHSADRQYENVAWHPGYVLLRRDERSLVCYKSEQAANRCGRDLTRVRLDGGYRAFYREWGYPVSNAYTTIPRLCTPTFDVRMFCEVEGYDEEEEDEFDDPVMHDRRYTTLITDISSMNDPVFNRRRSDLVETVSMHENISQTTISRFFRRKPKFNARSDTSYDLIDANPLISQSLDRRTAGWSLNQENQLELRRPYVVPMSGHGAHENHFDVTQSHSTSNKFTNFLSRPFRSNPLKRTKSVSKLDRKRSAFDSNRPNAIGALSNEDGTAWSTPALNKKNIANWRSHESLSYRTTTHAIDLASPPTTSSHENGAIGVSACTVTPLHRSVLGTPHCFQIRTDSGAIKYYACRTAAERDRWLECLNRTMTPNQEQIRREDNSLQIWILEIKGVPTKRRYYCELCLDRTLYSRTTAKLKTELCFWGEQFEINHLPKLETVCINVYREADRKKKKDRNTLVGYVQIPVHALSARHPVEKWYCVVGAEKMSGVSKGETTGLRVKAKYQSVVILPLRAYDAFLQYLQRAYLPLCLALEPSVSVKAKEDFATSMVRVLHKQRLAKEFLCDLVMSEVKTLDNEHLMFRGNSLATKAMEAYMKLVGDQYLHDTLGEFIQSAMESDDDCEVDPQKLCTNLPLLPKNQETLMNKVHLAWGKIVNSFYDFPAELRQVFFELRQRLHRCDRSELADYLISSSIFLRFLCPAILSPSLFNLVQEYPTGKTARSLTLIAKTIQTLANFTRFGGKEHYMEFMNEFVENECDHMRQYLIRISSPMNKDHSSVGSEWEGCIDVGKELSLLHSYLTECWVGIDIKRYRDAGLHELQKTLEQLTEAVQNPTSALNWSYPNASLSPVSPMSDYENNHTDESSPVSENVANNSATRSYLYKARSPLVGPYTPKRTTNDERAFREHTTSLRSPASNLQTDDDYVWYSALHDDHRDIRKHPIPSKHTPRTVTAQLVAGNGTEEISFVDDHSDYYSRPVTEEEDDDHDESVTRTEKHRASSDKNLIPVSPNCTVIVGTISSGYQSMNYSASSSPVDSCASTGNNSRASTGRKENQTSELHKRITPLAISNPLYSMQTVPLVQQKVPSYSLPDIHQTPSTKDERKCEWYPFPEEPRRPVNGNSRFPEHRSESSTDGYSVHNPQYQANTNVTFDEHRLIASNDQSGHVPSKSNGALFSTPPVMNNSNNRPQLPYSNGVVSIGSLERSPCSYHKSALPRTNPRYAMGSSPRLNGRTNGCTSTAVGEIGTTKGSGADAIDTDDAELSQKFIDELESMKKRLEETQSRILTEAPAIPNSTPPCSSDKANSISTAPCTLTRRTSRDENANKETWTDEVKPIISRLKVVEHELKEELNSSMKKQQIIDAQQKRIEMLVTANERLMATLSHLKDRYTGQDSAHSGARSTPETLDVNKLCRRSHSKISPVSSISSSASGSSSNDERTPSGRCSENGHVTSGRVTSGHMTTGHMTSGQSDASSTDSCFMRNCSSTSLPRSSSPQPPPQPMLPAPVLPQQTNRNSEHYGTVKMTQC